MVTRAVISMAPARAFGLAIIVSPFKATTSPIGRGSHSKQLIQVLPFRVLLATVMAARCPAVSSGDSAIAIGLKRTQKHESSYFSARSMV